MAYRYNSKQFSSYMFREFFRKHCKKCYVAVDVFSAQVLPRRIFSVYGPTQAPPACNAKEER